MKKYLIFAFERFGVFICNEVEQAGEILLIGKFNGTVEYTFIKNVRDVEVP